MASGGGVLIYQQGGVLTLDQPLPAQPSACTITIRTLRDKALSTIDSSFDDIEAETATAETLSLTLEAANRSARKVGVSAVAGTPTTGLEDDGYRLLIESSGRKQWVRVAETTRVAGDITQITVDEGINFSVEAGDTGKSVRCSYSVDWSSVTDTFTGSVKVTWNVTVSGVVQKYVRVVDVVRQVLGQPATWGDVVALRPDADDQTHNIRNKELLVRTAWEHLRTEMRLMGIMHNLIIPEGDSRLRDALVYQTIYNLSKHQGLPVPIGFSGDPREYIDDILRDRDKALGNLTMPVDLDEDGVLDDDERSGPHMSKVWFRHKRKVAHGSH